MKNRKLQIVIAILALIAAGCSSDNDDNFRDPAVTARAVADLAVSGTWVITTFIDEEDDETGFFDGYVFTFNEDGSLVADDGVNTVEGSWSVTVDDDDDDDDDYDDRDDVDFNIFFSGPPIFQELTDDWDIISRSENRIELGDDDDDDDVYDDEILIFERN